MILFLIHVSISLSLSLPLSKKKSIKTLRISKIRGCVKAQIEFSAFYRKNRAPHMNWCLATLEACKRCLEGQGHWKINLESPTRAAR